MSCFESIIGFTEKDCECQTANRPTDYNESKSGLYLDSFANISALIAASQCDDDMWKTLKSDFDLAVNQFEKDIDMLIGKQYKLKRKKVDEVVLGQIKAKDVTELSKVYSLTRFNCAPIKSGYMELKKIGTIFQNAGVKDIHIYDNVQGFIQTVSTVGLSNKHHQTDVNITLPLYSKFVDRLEYYFIYETDLANQPKDNKLSCGCGGWTPKYSESKPYYNEIGTPKKSPWTDYVVIGTTEIDSIVDSLEDGGMDDLTFSGTKMHGLTFEVGFKCLVEEVICKDSFDFKGNLLAKGVAFAILYRTAANVATSVLKSDNLDRENLLNEDRWNEDLGDWTDKYNEHVNFIADNIDISANDCLTCTEFIKVMRGGLFG